MCKYDSFREHGDVFRNLFGVPVQEFEKILGNLRETWKKEIRGGYRRPGRNPKVALPEQLMMLFLYCRSRCTQDMLARIFSVDIATICRTLQRIKPLVARICPVERSKNLTANEVCELFAAAGHPLFFSECATGVEN
jgi:hypothetical protein